MMTAMQRAAFTAGAGILAAVWLGPLPGLAREAFVAHMTMHMAVVAAAAPLIACAVAGTRWDPVARAPALFAPIPASILELVIVWGWHMPVLHHAARRFPASLALEQGMFLLAGLFVWIAALGGRDRARQGAAGVVALLLTSMHMTLLGALLALTARPLYAHHGGIAGLTALEDQHLGGAIMLLAGGVSYLAGGLALTTGLLTSRTAPGRETA